MKGPAKTFTPINVWDLSLKADTDLTLDLPEGHTAMIVVLTGHVDHREQPRSRVRPKWCCSIARGVTSASTRDGDSKLLVLTGEPIAEPIVGYAGRS